MKYHVGQTVVSKDGPCTVTEVTATYFIVRSPAGVEKRIAMPPGATPAPPQPSYEAKRGRAPVEAEDDADEEESPLDDEGSDHDEGRGQWHDEEGDAEEGDDHYSAAVGW